MALISAFLLPACQGQSSTSGGWISTLRLDYMAAVTIWGTLGSLLDSILGGLLQASVVDKRTGKVIEGSGGKKVRDRKQYLVPLLTMNSGSCL